MDAAWGTFLRVLGREICNTKAVCRPISPAVDVTDRATALLTYTRSSQSRKLVRLFTIREEIIQYLSVFIILAVRKPKKCIFGKSEAYGAVSGAGGGTPFKSDAGRLINLQFATKSNELPFALGPSRHVQ